MNKTEQTDASLMHLIKTSEIWPKIFHTDDTYMYMYVALQRSMYMYM